LHDFVKIEMRWTPPNSEWYFPTAFSDWNELEYNAVQRVIASGRFTMGPEVEQFEDEFAGYHRMKYCIAVNSGSSANLIMVAALFAKKDQPLKRGDTAIVPALAWPTTYAPLVQHGLRLKLEDCDNTWCSGLPDVTGAQLVVGVSILGNPAPLNFLKVAIESHSGYFIEDNCESLGAWYGNDRCGTFGLMNSFSFFHSHQISAVELGAILTNDPECARLCRILRNHGWTRDVDRPVGFNDSYVFTHFGYNVRPLEMHAAIAREQLKKLKGFIAARRKNTTLFRELTSELPITHPVIRTLDPSPFGLPFTVASSEIRLKLVERLREAGIDARLPTGGSFTKHVYGRPWAFQPTPNADCIHDTGLFIGNAPFDIADKIERAVEVMKKVLL
jgi:CDP-6-deoxy-D-xylo-4-hexulose-3-dehydrase